MKRFFLLAVLLLLVSVSVGAAPLSFEDRVNAREALERVYYSHQTGATRPFEEAVPRSVLEDRVRRTLQRSAALDELWHTPITSEALGREVERMIRESRMPERLEELFAALGDDPTLIEECLARPVLVDRLLRNFAAYDERIQGDARREAEGLHGRLVSGEIDFRADHPRRTVVVLAPGGEKLDREPGRRVVAKKQYDLLREGLAAVDEIGALQETENGFTIRVVLATSPQETTLADYVVAKRSVHEWWQEVESNFADRAASPILSGSDARPRTGPTEMLRRRERSVSTNGEPPCDPDDTWVEGAIDPILPLDEHTAVWTGSRMLVWGAFSNQMTGTGMSYDPATDTWTSISTEGAPTSREGHTAVWTGEHMVVWGGEGYLDPSRGIADFGFLATGGRYDPITNSWSPTSTVEAPFPRFDHTAVWADDRMVVWGGYAALGTCDLALATPCQFDSDCPEGDLCNGSFDWTNTGGRYNPVTDTWAPTAVLGAPTQRNRHTAVWASSPPPARGGPSGLMVVWGGLGYVDEFQKEIDYLGTGGRYDPIGNAWLPTSLVNAPAARSDHTAVWAADRVVVWGGYGFNEEEVVDSSVGGRYDPFADIWSSTALQAATPTARWFHSAVSTGSTMIVWGGEEIVPFRGGGDLENTGGIYDPATDTWTATATFGAPVGRTEHTAVWTGDRMIVWGGYSFSGDGNTGGRYDPQTDSWTPTATRPVPTRRAGHTAVWTGNEMIVWGGSPFFFSRGGLTYDRNGGRYNPATHSWAPTNPFAPEGRELHTAVWTGEDMIVWGGETQFGEVNDGGHYNPILDVWWPTGMHDAPTARQFHTAAWTGDEMIVWGGLGDGGFDGLDSGARYDPLTGIWAPTSTAGAPSPRYASEAVWTGDEMIVWGGFGETPVGFCICPAEEGGCADWAACVTEDDCGAIGDCIFEEEFLDTGARYDPDTDGWSPMSANGPEGRATHTATWTGEEMVVWGGYGFGTGFCPADGFPCQSDTDCDGPCLLDDEDFLGNGGRYDPVADDWAPMNPLAPRARAWHSAVWTGEEIVFWGGEGMAELGFCQFSGDVCASDFDCGADGPCFFDSESLDTGARYDPAGNTWQPTSTVDAPAGRWSHSAVWTGDHMIVWGGTAPGGATATGGLYALGHGDDGDGDGFSQCAGDCDDTDPEVNPGVTEVCGNGKDDDCNGLADDDDPLCSGVVCPDTDGDGWVTCVGCGPAPGDECGDCDDLDGNVNPEAPESCANGLDDDCDGLADGDDPDCAPAQCAKGDADCNEDPCDILDILNAIDQSLGRIPGTCEADVAFCDDEVDVFDVLCLIDCNLKRPSCIDQPCSGGSLPAVCLP